RTSPCEPNNGEIARLSVQCIPNFDLFWVYQVPVRAPSEPIRSLRAEHLDWAQSLNAWRSSMSNPCVGRRDQSRSAEDLVPVACASARWHECANSGLRSLDK